MFDSVFHGAPTSNNGQAVPSGRATSGIDVVSGQMYYKDPSHAGWQAAGAASGPFTGDYIVGPGLPGFPMNGVNTAKSAFSALNSSALANVVVCVKFTLLRSITLSKITWSAVDAGAGGSKVSFGIFNSAFTKVLDSGTFDGSIATAQTNSITPVTLQPGVYWFGITSSDVTITGVVAINVTTGNYWTYVNTASTKAGVAANSATAGALPSSLGSVLATPGSTTTYWMPVFE